jgi:hypothetical protein
MTEKTRITGRAKTIQTICRKRWGTRGINGEKADFAFIDCLNMARELSDHEYREFLLVSRAKILAKKEQAKRAKRQPVKPIDNQAHNKQLWSEAEKKCKGGRLSVKVIIADKLEKMRRKSPVATEDQARRFIEGDFATSSFKELSVFIDSEILRIRKMQKMLGRS